MVRVLFFLAAGCLLAACNQTNQTYDKPYFDFDSLVNAQITALVQVPGSLTKSVVLDGKSEQSTIPMDSTLVAHELDVFRQLDFINKPLYRNEYEISDGEKDSRSNLITRTYKAKRLSPVPLVTFYYHNSFAQLQKIESVYQENNTLYSAKRHLMLEFDDATGTRLLSRYKVSGTQKMILNDSVLFTIEGTFAPNVDMP